MKKAPKKLIEALLYKPISNSTKFTHKDKGDLGTELYKLYWSQEEYDAHRNSFRHNNYALLQNGLLITYSSGSYEYKNANNLYYLGEGIYHVGLVDGIYYRPEKEAYEDS